MNKIVTRVGNIRCREREGGSLERRSEVNGRKDEH